jgi:hypothetical protein
MFTTNQETSKTSMNYFTCTLGEAIARSHDFRDLNTINDFIDHQAKKHPEGIAIGFPVPGAGNQNWEYECFSRF